MNMNIDNLNLAIACANAVVNNANLFTKREQLVMINEIPIDIRLTARIDRLVRRLGCFDGVLDFIDVDTSYRPTIDCRLGADYRLMADYYDACMAQLGSDKRAYRIGWIAQQ